MHRYLISELSPAARLNKIYPYTNETLFNTALTYNPQILIIKLGTNDSKSWNWIYKNDFFNVRNNLTLCDARINIINKYRITAKKIGKKAYLTKLA